METIGQINQIAARLFLNFKYLTFSFKNDVVTGLLEVAKEPHQQTIQNLAILTIVMKFAGIHTTSLVRKFYGPRP